MELWNNIIKIKSNLSFIKKKKWYVNTSIFATYVF